MRPGQKKMLSSSSISRGVSVLSTPSTTSVSACAKARFSVCWAPTGPANRRCSACSAASCPQVPARCASPASICVGRRHPRVGASAIWHRNSRSTATSRYAKTCNSLRALTAFTASGGETASHGRSRSSSSAIPPRRQAAPRARLRLDARTGDPVPRRANLRGRSAGAARLLAAHQRPRRSGGDGPRHHPFHGRGGILRSPRHHGAWAHPRRGPFGGDQGPFSKCGPPRTDDGRRLCRFDPRRRPGESGMSDVTELPHVIEAPAGPSGRGSLRRLRGLLRKEFLQVGRDPSSIAIAFLLPAVLLLLFGYGVSLDARNVPVALVVEQPSDATASFTARFRQSPYFRPQDFATIQQADRAMAARQVQGIVWLRSDFARQLQPGEAPIGVIVNGVDANDARIIEGYLQQIWAGWIAARAQARGLPSPVPVLVEPRVWFNPAISSRDYLVPGLIAIIMSLTGALLTAMVIAREWERGTMEALMVTRVSIREILLGKLVPYFVLGMGGMAASVAMAVCLFGVPLRGSVLLLAVGSG